MITERYRTNYTGEFVITNSLWAGGKKRIRREWIPNPIENNHISGRAACIGSIADRSEFDFKLLENHRGGLLGTAKLQTYGCGDVAELMKLDFVVERNSDKLHSLIENHYYKQSTIYTSPRWCLEYPGVFYPIPYNPNVIPQVALAYLAAFDGHKEVFLLGYHDDAGIGHKDWAGQMNQVIQAFPSTKFIHVSYTPQTPSMWKENSNFSHLAHRAFIIHCDI